MNSDIQKFISCSIDQLSVQYGQNMVFDKANFNFSSGQITAVVGMSGVGKTTLAKSIVDWWRGYDGPTISGHILFYKNNHSKSLSQAYAPQKGLDIAYVPQDATMCFNPLSTVGEQIIEQYVAHKRVPYHEAKEKVIQALILMLSKDAIHVFGAYPYEISGGQAQRAMLVMSMIHSPRILILDEATSALDYTSAHSVLSTIQTWSKDQNATVIWISHDISLVLEYAEEIILLRPQQNDRISKTREGQWHMPTDIKQMLALANPPTPYRGIKPSHTPIICQINDVSIQYQHSLWSKNKKLAPYVISDVHLGIYKGVHQGWIGPSGSGKSTLAKCVSGILRPTKGDIFFPYLHDTASVSIHRKSLSQCVQYVFQDAYSSFNPLLTVGASLLEVARCQNYFKDKGTIDDIGRWIEGLGLDAEYLNRYPYQVSGGQLQRFNVARAFLCRPLLVILDEALSSLDPIQKSSMKKWLIEQASQFGISYIFITHRYEDISDITHETYSIGNGKVIPLSIDKN